MPQTFMTAGHSSSPERKVQEFAHNLPEQDGPYPNTMRYFYGNDRGDTDRRFGDESYLNEDPIFFRDRDHLEFDNSAKDLYNYAAKATDPAKKEEAVQRLRRYEMWRQGRNEEPYEYIKREKRKEHVKTFDRGNGLNYVKMFQAGPDHAHEHMTEEKRKAWVDAFYGEENATDQKRQALLAGLISEWAQVPVEQIDKNYPAYRQAFMSEIGVQGQVDDVKAFSESSRWLKRRTEQAEKLSSVIERTAEIIDRSIIQGLGSKETLEAATDELLGEFGEDAIDKATLAQAVQKSWTTKVRQYAPYIQDARSIYETAKSAIDDSKSRSKDSSIEKRLRSVASLERKDRQNLLYLIYKMAEQDSGEHEGGFGAKVGQSFLRGVYDYVDNQLDALEVIGNVEIESSDKNVIEWQKNKTAYERNLREFRQDLRGIRDIVRRIESDNGAIQGIYDAATSVPYTLAAATPHGGGIVLNALAMSTQNDMELRAKYPDMNPDLRWKMASSGGVVQSLIERASFKAVVKPFPKLQGAFNKIGIRGTAGTLASRIGGGFAVEYGEEALQEITVPVIQDIAGMLNEEIPDVTAEEWKHHTRIFRGDSRTAWAVLPLAVIMGGGSTAIDRIGAGKAREFLGRADAIWLAGVTQEEAQAISTTKDPLKAQKMLLSAVEAKTDEELNDNKKQAIDDGAENRLVEQYVEEHGTKEEKATLRAETALTNFENKFYPSVKQSEDGRYEVRYPELHNKPSEFFESEAEAGAARDAILQDMGEQDIRDMELSEANIKAMQLAKESLEDSHEGAEIKISKKNDITLEKAVEQGLATVEQLMERVNIFAVSQGKANTMTWDEAKAKYTLPGQVMLKQKVRGYVARLTRGAGVQTLYEEGSEGYIREMMQNEIVTEDFLTFHLRQYEQDTGEQLFQHKDKQSSQEVIEAFSKLSQAHVWNSRGDERMNPKLGALIDLLRQFFKAILQTAENLLALKKKGLLDQEFEKHLDRAIGLDEDQLLENQRRQHEQDMLEEMSDPHTEIQVMMKGQLMRPSDMKKGDPMYGEIKDLYDHFRKESKFSKTKKGKYRVTSSGSSSLFAKKGEGVELDVLREKLNEKGFEFDTPADMLEALDLSLRGMKQFPTIDPGAASDIEQGRTFSIASNGAYVKGGWWHHATDNELKGGKLKRFAGGSDSDMGGIFLVDDSTEGKSYSAGYGNKMYRVRVNLDPDEVFNLGNSEHLARVEPIELDDAVGRDFVRNAASSAREGTLDWTAIEPELLEAAGFKAAILYERPSGMYGKNPVRSLSVFDENSLSDLEQVPAEELQEIRQNHVNNPDSSFSIGVDESNMVAVHNLSADNLKFAEENFGVIPPPSIAILRTDISKFEGFGEISLLVNPSFIDPAKSRDNKIWNADAYTPRFPTFVYAKDEKVANDIWLELKEHSEAIGGSRYGVIPDGFERDGMKALEDSAVFQYAYLKEIGKAPRVVKEKRSDVAPALAKYAKGKNRYDLAKDPEFEKLVKVELEKVIAGVRESFREKRRESYFNDDGSVYFRTMSRYADEASDYHKELGIDELETKRAIQIRIESHRKKFNVWLRDRFSALEKGKKIPNGFTPMGNKKFLPFNLDNVVKSMTRNVKVGEGFNYGVGSIRAAASKQFKSIEDVKGDREKIVTSETMEAFKDEVSTEFDQLAEALNPFYKYDKTAFGYYDAVSEGLMNLAGVRGSAWRDSFENVDREVMQEVHEFLNKLKHAPTEYFEVKVMDGVNVNAFDVAVIPKNIDAETKNLLKRKGLKIRLYDPKIEGNRQDVIKSAAKQKKISFSLGQVEDPVITKLQSLMRDPDTRVALYKVIQQRLERVRTEIATREIKSIISDKESDDRIYIMDGIAQLQALVSALPVEIRGKVGGWRKIASYKTNRGVNNFLKNRLEKIDDLLEKHIRDEYIERIDKLIEKATPKKGNAKIAKGKITPEGHAELDEIVKVVEMSPAEVADAVNTAELDLSRAESIDDTDEREAAIIKANAAIGRLSTFGNLKSKSDPMSALGAQEAHAEIDHLVTEGRSRYMLHLVAQKEHRQGLKRSALEVITGGRGRKLRAERLKDGEDGQKKSWLKQEHARNVSFEMMLNGLSRMDKDSSTLDSWLNQYFGQAVHKATHGEAIAANRKKVELLQVVAAIYGVDTESVGWQGRVEDVMASMSERHADSGIFIEEQAGKQVLRSYRAEVEAIVAGQITHVHSGYSWIELTKKEIAQFKALLAADNSKKKGQPKLNFEITRKTDGVITEQYMSQDSAMFLSMMWRQVGLRPAMEAHGYNDKVMKQFEKFLTRESKLLRTWMFRQYDLNHDYFNKTFKKMFGVNLVKVKNYSPAKSIHGGRQVKDMIDASHGKQSTTPGMAMERIQHQAEPRYDVGAIQAYLQHVDSTEHFVHWAEPVAELRSVFMDKDVREAILDHHGPELYAELIERIDMFADGGNMMAKTNRFADHLRKTFTVAKLAFNWGVFLKQLTSLPAYGFDMPVKDFLKYEAEFLGALTRGDTSLWKKMWKLPYTQNRFDAGYDRDVMAVINSVSKRKGKFAKAAEWGMITGRAGDIIPVIVGGYAAYRYHYEKAKAEGKTDAQAEAIGVLQFEMSTDRAQQSGNIKDQSSYGLGGSLFRVFTMFQTSPRQYYANMMEAILDAKAGRKGGGKRAAKAAFIAHVVLPSLFYWMSAGTRNLFRAEGDRDDLDELLKGWMKSMALGPFAGVFLWGQIGSELSSGYEYSMPVFEFGKEAMDASSKLGRMWKAEFDDDDATQIESGDVIGFLDNLARTGSLAIGGWATWYDIGTRASKSFGFTQDRVERIMMSEIDGIVLDLGKVQSEIYEEKLPDKDEFPDEREEAKQLRYEKLAEEYSKIKAENPSLWPEIAEKLRKKNKLPEAVEDLMD